MKTRWASLAAACAVAACATNEPLSAQGRTVNVVDSRPEGCASVGKLYGAGSNMGHAMNALRNITAEEGGNTVVIDQADRVVWDNLVQTNVGIAGNDHRIIGDAYRC